MSERISYFGVGLFVLTGTAIVIGGLIWLGLTQIFSNAQNYVTYFQESVGGLSSGSDIDYKGIKVGRVGSVRLTPDEELVAVTLQIDRDFKVKDDMAVKLGFHITGQQTLSIVKAPSDLKKYTPAIDFTPEYPLIPAARGDEGRIKDALEKVYQKVKRIDLEKLVTAWKDVANDADRVITGEQVQETLDNIRAASSDMKSLLQSVGTAGASRDLKSSLDDISKAAEATRKASEIVARQLEALSPQVLSRVADDLEKMVKTSENSVRTVRSHVDQSMELIQQSLFQMNQVLAEIKELTASLRESPGRIFTHPSGGEPFRR